MACVLPSFMPADLRTDGARRRGVIRLYDYVRSEDILAALHALPHHPEGLTWDMCAITTLDVPPDALPAMVAAIKDLKQRNLGPLTLRVTDAIVYDFAHLLMHLSRVYAAHTVHIEARQTSAPKALPPPHASE